MLQQGQQQSEDLDEIETEITSSTVQEQLQMRGSITHLMMNSKLHLNDQVSDISQRFIPSLIYNQFRYCEIDGEP